MNRHMAILLMILLVGLTPKRLPAQEPRSRESSSTSTKKDRALKPAGKPPGDLPADEPEHGDIEDPAAGFAREAGYQWKTFDISRYTRVAQAQQNPQKAIIDWVFRRTGTAEWHGDKIAVLCASKTQLRAYNSPEVLKQVEDVVERFTDATDDILAVHVRFFVATDTNWRHTVYSQLKAVGNGAQGQQIWTMRMTDAVMLVTQLQSQQALKTLYDGRLEMVNGQLLTIRTAEPRTYSGGIQRESAAGQGYTPRADKLEESIVLKLSPLLTYEGDSVDASIDLAVNTVRMFHRTKVVVPRGQGAPEMTIDVPEVSLTRIEQTVRKWPLGQTLLITGGIQPGVLDKKGGWLGTSFGAPTTSEVLVFLDTETISKSRPKETAEDEEEPPARSTKTSRREVDAEDDDPPPARTRKTKRTTRGPDVESEANADTLEIR